VLFFRISKPYFRRLATPRVVNRRTRILDQCPNLCSWGVRSSLYRLGHIRSYVRRTRSVGSTGPRVWKHSGAMPDLGGIHLKAWVSMAIIPSEPCLSLSAAHCSRLSRPRSSPPFYKALSFFGVLYDCHAGTMTLRAVSIRPTPRGRDRLT